MDLIPTNVSDKTERPKIDKFEASFYTKDELQELFKVFKGDKLELIVNIAAYYGLRRSEIIILLNNDVKVSLFLMVDTISGENSRN